MHGLIFMTWEKYLEERFGTRFLQTYRERIGESSAALPLANRLYEDATLVAGVGAASQLASVPAEMLLQEYGRYFILNWLTSHLCLYILTSVESGRDLLLAMRDAHARLRRTNESLQPRYLNTARPPATRSCSSTTALASSAQSSSELSRARRSATVRPCRCRS